MPAPIRIMTPPLAGTGRRSAAARLAAGEPTRALGPSTSGFVRLPWPEPVHHAQGIDGVWLAVIIGTLTTVAGVVLTGPLVAAFGAGEEVYEATMRCNLQCEFCYVGDLLNVEGEWREELNLDALRKAFPEREGFQVSLTGGEIFMRKDILSVLDLFREKQYACGYLTTNGTIINEAGGARVAGDAPPCAHELFRRVRRHYHGQSAPSARRGARRRAPPGARGLMS